MLGTLASPSGAGAIEVAVSRDGRFAFVSLEASARVAVFDLRRALTRASARPTMWARSRSGWHRSAGRVAGRPVAVRDE